MALELQVERLADGSAIVLIDDSQRPGVTLDAAALDVFEAALEKLEADPELSRVVLASAKPGVFLLGADLRWLQALTSSAEAAAMAERGQRLLDRWRALRGIKVAAIAGSALGGGLEIALACDLRIAADLTATRLALPEVRLGLMPALGGTYHLPRLVGLTAGLGLLLSGRRLTARQALASGVVDQVVPASELRRAALEAAAESRGRRPAGPKRWLVEGNPWGRRWVLQQARRRVLAKTGGCYPAPLRIVEAVVAGYRRGRDAGLAAERRGFAELALGPEARNLVWLFLATRELGGRHEAAPPLPAVGIIGAGFMGSGIAAAAARSGLEVALVDEDRGALERAERFCRHRFASLERRGKLDAAESDAVRQRIRVSSTTHGLEKMALVIEAVSESREVKREVFRDLERRVSSRAVLGSNTSTIPIARLAVGLAHPERLVGIHFFSPVHRMPLVEIVRHAGTADFAVDAAVALAIRLHKVPIVVRDGPGFYTSRILTPYLAQAAAMLQEGLAIAAIDGAARRAGFPVGPLELLDEVGIDIAMHASRTMSEAMGERMPSPEVLARMVAAGRLGRKSGAGFYDYRRRRKRADAAVARLVSRPRSSQPAVTAGELGRRLLLSMSLEAVRCLEDGIIERPRDGDVGAVLGLGFPAFLGGPFRWLDRLGTAPALEQAAELLARFGPLFESPPMLQRLARGGRGFYDEPGLSERL